MRYATVEPNGYMYMIFPNLYVGGFNASTNYEYLKLHNITHIINCAGEKYIIHEPDIKVYNLNLFDSPLFPIHEYFEPTANLIAHIYQQNPNNRVLVSCAMGINRSMSILIAYLLYSTQRTLQDIIKHIVSLRPYAMLTNMAFYNQLCLYDSSLRNVASNK